MKFLQSSFLIYCSSACETLINIRAVSQKEIVDGSALDYFNRIAVKILVAPFVANAKVSLADAFTEINLKEYGQSIAGNYNIVYYSNGTSGNANIIGQIGKTYKTGIITRTTYLAKYW